MVFLNTLGGRWISLILYALTIVECRDTALIDFFCQDLSIVKKFGPVKYIVTESQQQDCRALIAFKIKDLSSPLPTDNFSLHM